MPPQHCWSNNIWCVPCSSASSGSQQWFQQYFHTSRLCGISQAKQRHPKLVVHGVAIIAAGVGIQPVANQHEQIGMGQLPVWCWCCFPICMSATGILQQQLPAWPEIHSHARMDWRALYNLYMIWARLNAHTILLFHAQSETSARTCWTQLQHADLTACTLP